MEIKLKEDQIHTLKSIVGEYRTQLDLMDKIQQQIGTLNSQLEQIKSALSTIKEKEGSYISELKKEYPELRLYDIQKNLNNEL